MCPRPHLPGKDVMCVWSLNMHSERNVTGSDSFITHQVAVCKCCLMSKKLSAFLTLCPPLKWWLCRYHMHPVHWRTGPRVLGPEMGQEQSCCEDPLYHNTPCCPLGLCLATSLVWKMSPECMSKRPIPRSEGWREVGETLINVHFIYLLTKAIMYQQPDKHKKDVSSFSRSTKMP